MLFGGRLSICLLGLVSLVVASSGRTLQAATLNSHLKQRDTPFSLSSEAVLAWSEGSNNHGDTCFGATVKIASKKHILLLEDMEQFFSTIECKSGTIVLKRAHHTTQWFLTQLHDLLDGHIITSHASCNAKHERVPYKVVSIISISEDTATLKVVPARWQLAFDTVKIDFGYTKDALELRDRHHFRRSLESRQADNTPSQPISAVPSLSQANPSPVGTSAPTSTRLNLATSISNSKLPLPSGSPVDVTCLECSMEGSVDFVSASFDITDMSLTNVVPDLTGSASITAHGVKAHVKLSTTVRESWTFMAAIFSASSNSILIPGIGAASILFGPFIAGGFNYTGTLSLTEYGFNMEVPEGASASISINTDEDDAVNATQTQWDNTKFTALPWNSQVQVKSLDLWLALRSTFQAKFRFQDDLIDDSTSDMFDSFDFRAGIYIDTPVINATAKSLSGVKADCTSGGDLQNILSVDFTRSWNFGAYIKGSYDDKPFPPGTDGEAGVFRTGQPVPVESEKQCLQYDEGAKSYSKKNSSAGAHVKASFWTVFTLGCVAVLLA